MEGQHVKAKEVSGSQRHLGSCQWLNIARKSEGGAPGKSLAREKEYRSKRHCHLVPRLRGLPWRFSGKESVCQ